MNFLFYSRYVQLYRQFWQRKFFFYIEILLWSTKFSVLRIEKKMAKIGINGFGRIGRMCLRICLEKNLEV